MFKAIFFFQLWLPLAAFADIDFSMITLCQKAVDGDKAAISKLAIHPLSKKMANGMNPHVVFSPKEFADGSNSTKKDPRFSWEEFKERSNKIKDFLKFISLNHGDLFSKAKERATQFLEPAPDVQSVPIYLVCGGAWDAYVLYFDQGPEIFFDVGKMESDTITNHEKFIALLTHELWHIAFIDYQRKYWVKNYKTSEDPTDIFFFTMLNEGMGHFFSMSPRLFPIVDYPDFKGRSIKIFSLLKSKYQQYKNENNWQVKKRLLWTSHAGVPFWEKWGAVSAALVIYHLNNSLGKKALIGLLAKNPFEYLLRYETLSEKDSKLPKLPKNLRDELRKQ